MGSLSFWLVPTHYFLLIILCHYFMYFTERYAYYLHKRVKASLGGYLKEKCSALAPIWLVL